MRRYAVYLCASLFALFGAHAFADLAAIQQNALPQDAAVLAALDDARQMEPYARVWYADWSFSIAKKDVATHLGNDLVVLSAALKSHPENVDLQLLTGLVAHYAYNVDVPETQDSILRDFDQVHALAPDDIRGSWFHAAFLCQTKQTNAGAQEFLSIENGATAEKLPPAFWDDYLECATATNMPAHALRALAHLQAQQAPASTRRTQLEGIDQGRFTTFDPSATLGQKDVWSAADSAPGPQFTSTLCGLRLTAHDDWGVTQLGWNHGACIAIFSTGPYQATKHKLSPSVVILVQQAKPGETLEDYLQKFMSQGTYKPFTPAACPAAACLAMNGVQSGQYGKDGDGHSPTIVFERDQPQFPGLLFEVPNAPQISSATPGIVVYRPAQTRQRIPGKLFYAVFLDTASSIDEPAMKDFDFFLKNLVIE